MTINIRDIDISYMAKITKEMAYNMKLVSFREEDNVIKFYAADKVDKNYLSLLYKKQIEIIKASEEEIVEILDRIYGSESDEGDKEQFIKKQLNILISKAIELEVSDIHIEPQKKYVIIRFRKDGMLFIYKKIQFSDYQNITIRIKLLANMDIADKLRAQDGKMIYQGVKDEYDLRVSTIPSIYGEKIVMRILYKNQELINLNKLNFTENQLIQIQKLIKLKHGMVLINGPTGSGKSTTLYSILKEINNDNINITTIEDPVEFCISGITQININEKAGLTFASGLRHLLRQDPDVILLGEIRDEEAARIAIRAAITGHKVFSTIHTNTPKEVFYRLLDMGIEKYLLLQAINGIISQRLIRKLCNKCKTPYNLSDFEKISLGFKENNNIFGPVGCSYCNHTGYSGRTMVSEVLVVNGELKEKFRKNEDLSDSIEESMLDNCKALVENGITSIEEYLNLKQSEGELNDG